MRQSIFFLDWRLILPVLFLILISLTVLLSLDPIFFKSQIASVVIGLLFLVFFSTLDYRALGRFTTHFYIGSVVVLALIIFLGIEARGATRWIEIFGMRVQFSEVLKPFLLISLSSWLVRHEDRLTLSLFIKTLLLIIPIFFLIFWEPDLGNALIYLGTALFILFYFGFPIRYFLTMLVMGFLSLPLFWFILRDYQRQRILTFINPGIDPLGVSYNAIQALIAVGSGEFFGRGLGHGTQSQLRFLPERHTDFIFATLSEELGFVGAFAVIIIFAILLYRIFIISRMSRDVFGEVFAMASFFLLLVQGFMNVGMNLSVVPVAGVTLPFLSFGGSSFVSNCIIIGILCSIARSLRKAQTLEIK